jgi:hypothetical protein
MGNRHHQEVADPKTAVGEGEPVREAAVKRQQIILHRHPRAGTRMRQQSHIAGYWGDCRVG